MVAGGALGALRPLRPPGSAADFGAWGARLVLAQEALTLLRGLSAAEHLREAVAEEIAASPASLRLCHIVPGARLALLHTCMHRMHACMHAPAALRARNVPSAWR